MSKHQHLPRQAFQRKAPFNTRSRPPPPSNALRSNPDSSSASKSRKATRLQTPAHLVFADDVKSPRTATKARFSILRSSCSSLSSHSLQPWPRNPTGPRPPIQSIRAYLKPQLQHRTFQTDQKYQMAIANLEQSVNSPITFDQPASHLTAGPLQMKSPETKSPSTTARSAFGEFRHKKSIRLFFTVSPLSS